MDILNVYNFTVKKKDSLLILSSKDEKEPFVITFSPAGWHIDTPTFEALYCSNNEVCYSVKGRSLRKYRYVLPYTLEFKLNKKDESTKNMYDLCRLMDKIKINAKGVANVEN
jgi:hypothetical protein